MRWRGDQPIGSCSRRDGRSPALHWRGRLLAMPPGDPDFGGGRGEDPLGHKRYK